jgi:hypothetical protein
MGDLPSGFYILDGWPKWSKIETLWLMDDIFINSQKNMALNRF